MSVMELIFWAVLAAVVWAAGYAVACWWWPFTACSRCKGNGRFRSPSGKNFRLCGRCKGGGTRLRMGRKVLNVLAGQKKSAR
jgi:hypothetical protein